MHNFVTENAIGAFGGISAWIVLPVAFCESEPFIKLSSHFFNAVFSVAGHIVWDIIDSSNRHIGKRSYVLPFPAKSMRILGIWEKSIPKWNLLSTRPQKDTSNVYIASSDSSGTEIRWRIWDNFHVEKTKEKLTNWKPPASQYCVDKNPMGCVKNLAMVINCTKSGFDQS